MSVINNNLLLAAEDGGYVIDRSLRFRASASAYLSRTPASAGNRKTWTWSSWVKRGELNTFQRLLEVGSSISDRSVIGFTNNNTLEFFNTVSSTSSGLVTTQVFRDPSAWYHIIVAMDTTQATASNRTKMYVNGVQVTAFGAANYVSQNADTFVNAAVIHRIAANEANGNVLDGYLTEVNFIDGSALDPTSFGEYNATTGVWQPKAYDGTYGTNGFYLNFSDPTNTTTLTADQSGNGNNWTANNISLTSGATYDSMIDTPTPVADVRGNFAVLNPLWTNRPTISSGNLNVTGPDNTAMATMGMSSGKWYFETTVTNVGNITAIGMCATQPGSTNYPGFLSDGYAYLSTGTKQNNNTTTSYGASYTTGDIIGCAFDSDAGTLTFYKNNVSQGTAFSSIPSKTYYFAVYGRESGGSNNLALNFGQRPFAYTPPSGFKALHTGNLPEPAIVDGKTQFDVKLDTGANIKSTSEAVYTHQLAWIKDRANSNNHQLIDSVRGTSAVLQSNTTAAETTYSTPSGSSVAWVWKAENTGVTNTAGSITSTVSANPTAGFSIVTYTGNGSTGQVDSVGHGLGIAPKLYFIKQRNDVNDWYAFTSAIDGGWDFGLLNTTQAFASTNQYADSTRLFLSGASTNVSGGTYVAYCFAEVPGYSRFGSYTGNGSTDGPFVFCGFRPAFVMWKRSSGTENWLMTDSKRNTFNVVNSFLFPNLSNAETTNEPVIDYLSNGFKLRASGAAVNGSGSTYIFMAFAENPLKYALAR